MSVDFYGDGIVRYGWAHPSNAGVFNCIYLNINAEEVVVRLVDRSNTPTEDTKRLGLVCVGQVVFCLYSMYGHRQVIPPHVQKWIDETRAFSGKKELTQTITFPTVNIKFEDWSKIASAFTLKTICWLAYSGTGDCTCGKCSIRQLTIAGSKNIFQYPKEML
jgi:hypothetical protein